MMPLILASLIGGSPVALPPGGLSTNLGPWVVCLDGTASHGGCPTAGAPGPAPILGAVAGFHWSRQLRRRIRRAE